MAEPTDRAQLLLVGAVVVATAIVSMVVLLNGVQFTETVGTQQSLDATTEADQQRAAVREDLQSLLWAVDAPGPYAATNETFRENVTVYSSTLANMSAASGPAAVSLRHEWAASRNGSVAYQHTDQPFDSGGSVTRNRTVAENVDSLAVAEFNATERTGSDPFVVNVTADGSSASLRLFVSQDSVELVRNDGTTTRLCDGPLGASEAVSVHVRGTTGRVTTTTDAVDCRSFRFAPAFGGPYDVTFNNSDTAEGTYNVSVATGTSGSVPTGAAPETATDVIVDPAYELTYHSQELSYNTTVRTYGAT